MNNNQSGFYSRQIKLVGSVGQEKIKESSVLVIGAGGLGCPVLLYLAAMGVGHLGIVDDDKVDISNLHRQILYTPKDIGVNKSQVAAQKINEQNPYIDVSFFLEKLNVGNIERIFKNYEIIVDCTDNFETKFMVHDACYLQNKKLVQASIYQYEGNLHVFDFSSHVERENAPCLRCLWTKEPEDGYIGTCADVGVIGATAGVLGSLQAIEVSKLILGKKSLKNGEGLFVDLNIQDYEKRRWKKNNDCIFCSERGKIIKTESFQGVIDYKISIDQAKMNDDLIWVDLRNKEEAQKYAINQQGLLQMSLTEFNISKLDPRKKYLLICQKGYKSNQVTRVFREMGYNNLFSLIDGVEGIFYGI